MAFGQARTLMDISSAPRVHRLRNGAEELIRRRPDPERVATFLGWFSIGLGVVETLAPGPVARFLGLRRRPPLMRTAFGAREIAAGVGILSQPQPAGWLWARVAGDVVDLAALSAMLRSTRREDRVIASIAAVVGIIALDIYCARELSRDGEAGRAAAERGTMRVKKSIVVERPPDELYRFWRNFENLPKVMTEFEAVRVLDDERSHWVAKGPAGMTVEWDSKVVDDRPNQLIAWRSLERADIEHAGSVRFEPLGADHRTLVTVDFQYRPPGGSVGAMVSKLFGREPAQQMQQDLRRFKQLMETGEIPTTSGQPSGRGGAVSRMLRGRRQA